MARGGLQLLGAANFGGATVLPQGGARSRPGSRGFCWPAEQNNCRFIPGHLSADRIPDGYARGLPRRRMCARPRSPPMTPKLCGK